MEVLAYDPETGIFVWRESNRGLLGQVAGAITNEGYRRIMIDGVRYVAHRLAWLYAHGFWPQGALDHRDRQRDNNAIRNLRLATGSQNAANRKAHTTNKLGVKGVRLHECGKYVARIGREGTVKYLGAFDTQGAAKAAYDAAAASIYGEFARAA